MPLQTPQLERILPQKEINRIAVVGAGTMGHGIAQISALAGISTTITDVSTEILQKGLERIKWSLDKLVEKRTIRQEQMESTLSRISSTQDLATAVSNVDYVIEAAPEDSTLKQNIFTQLDKHAPAHTILASNTSSLSITALGSATKRPEKTVGMHFFNPPQLMPLVEVVKGSKTSDETAQTTLGLAQRLGKTPVLVKKDVRGFIVNSVLGYAFNEAFWALQRGEASKEQIDSAVKYKAGFPMGMFELADYIGLDIINNASKQIASERTEAKIPPILDSLVKSGKLGQKTGEGFYSWKEGRPKIPFELADDFDINRIYASSINGAAWLVQEDVAIPQDVDTALKFGAGWPSGPCELADRLGIDVVVTKLKELETQSNDPMYRPCTILVEYSQKGWTGRKSKHGFYTYA